MPALAQGEMVAQAEEIPETILITGSLIRGTAAVGVPVINLAPRDFAEVGALTTADLFRTVPQAVVASIPNASSSAGNQERNTRVNLRGLDSPTGARSLFMVDGARHPAQTTDACSIDPSIIPALAVERIDVLVDGASATYGSDAIGGVLNIILKRMYDGAVTQARFTTAAGGEARYQASQLWGRTWDGGGVTLTYEWSEETPAAGNFHSQNTIDHSPWGLEDRTPIGSSIPGTISRGAPAADPLVNHGSSSAGAGGSPGGPYCTNCYAIPLGTGSNWDPGASGVGPTAPSSGATLMWDGTTFVALSNGELAGYGSDGTRNITNPYHLAWYTTYQHANRAVITLDQRLTSNISFYGEGYYSNRRSNWLNPPVISQTENAVLTMPVPTFNPYYPVGYSGTPLRVSYTTIKERPTFWPAHAVDLRYLFGLNFALPAGWAGEAHWAYSVNQSNQHIIGAAPNKNAVSAALGWTMNAQGASGTTPALATWTKPANVPYLNLFCDPTQYVCNDSATLDYIMGYRQIDTKFVVNEKAGRVDGPLFDLPGGVVKAAVGASYTTYNFHIREIDNRQSENLLVNLNVGSASRAFWAVFTQVNVPVISDVNSLPFVRALELEVSWRHDQYSDVGGTSNAKVAFNWSINDDFTIRGGWGESFRAPSFGETSEEVAYTTGGWNFPPGVVPPNQTLRISCTGGAPNPGSGAEEVFNIYSAPFWGCGQAPGGLNLGGSSTGAATHGARDIVNTDQKILEPEKAMNWSLGFDYSPTSILQGLNLQVTWYKLKVNGVIDSGFQLNPGHLNDPVNGYRYIVPADLGCDSTGVAPGTPPVLWCAPFAQLVDTMLADPRAVPPPSARTLVYWVADQAGMNQGYEQVEGIDWQASYDWEWGDLGAFNVGIVGTYYLNRNSADLPGQEPTDSMNTTIDVAGIPLMEGVSVNPRMRYRARLGWANGTWSVTGFFNYRTHYWTNSGAPPNVNNQCQTDGGTVGGGTFPCAITGYTNLFPPIHSFDLSIGYETGDRPANEYLRNIGFQLVVQNLFDKHPPYAYITGNRPGAWATGAQGGANEINALGRMISLIVTKTW